MAEKGTSFEVEHHLLEAVCRLRSAMNLLCELGFTGDDLHLAPQDASVVSSAKPHVIDVVDAGERLLLYHKRLARSSAAYGFLHQHDLVDHWDRYEASGRTPRVVNQLMRDTAEVLRGYQELIEADERFLVDDLGLPPELEAEFRLARNLFSLGFDDIGLLVAGRGLEGVLRKIAGARKIMLETKGRPQLAAEGDLHDLIETIWRVRWKVRGNGLITAQTKTLLHYLRTVRNGGAHGTTSGAFVSAAARDTAAVVARTASRLWIEVTTTRAQIATTTIKKTW
jgi:hypothetical protein